MQQNVPFEPHRFSTAAAHYRGGRPPYAPALVRHAAEAVGLGLRHAVLDLGCGPGPLAIGLAYFAGRILALDPEPNMLREAEQAARGLAPNVTFREGGSRDLGADFGAGVGRGFGRFRLVAMGRSFHWMDRAETLRRLDELIEPDGAIALFSDVAPEVPDNAWRQGWRDILDRYQQADPSVPRRRPGERHRHEAVLLDSPFCALQTHSILDRRTVATASLVDRALSMSTTSAARIGDRAGALQDELRRYFADLAPDGVITEVVESKLLLAFRPGPGTV